jgi:hypothetical protein
MNKFAIFLDFDDVLIEAADQKHPLSLKSNYWTTNDFSFNSTSLCALRQLITHLEEAGVSPIVVLSTSWIKYATRKVLRQLLSRNFPKDAIDSELTFSCRPVVVNRRQRIEVWLTEYADQLATPHSYFILDDTYSGTGLVDFRYPSPNTNTLDQRTLLTNWGSNGASYSNRFLTTDHTTLITTQLLYLQTEPK